MTIYDERGGNTVSVISDATNTVLANVTVGNPPRGVAYDSAKGEVFYTQVFASPRKKK